MDGRDRRPHQITGQARTRTRIIRYSNTSRPPKSRITRVKPYYEPYIMSCLRIRHCNFLSAPGTEYGTAGVTTGGRGVPALISRGQVGRGGVSRSYSAKWVHAEGEPCKSIPNNLKAHEQKQADTAHFEADYTERSRLMKRQ